MILQLKGSGLKSPQKSRNHSSLLQSTDHLTHQSTFPKTFSTNLTTKLDRTDIENSETIIMGDLNVNYLDKRTIHNERFQTTITDTNTNHLSIVDFNWRDFNKQSHQRQQQSRHWCQLEWPRHYCLHKENKIFPIRTWHNYLQRLFVNWGRGVFWTTR